MPASKAQAEAMPAATEKDDVAVWIPCSCPSLCPVRTSLCHALAMSAQRPQKPKQLHTHTHLPHLQRRGSDVCCNCNGTPDAGRMPRRLNHPVWPMHLNGGAAAGAVAIYM